MNRLALCSAVMLAFGTLALAHPAGANQGPNATDAEIPLIDTLEMERERHRRLTVPVMIQGEGPFDFMVDTGAQATVLSITLADQLELFDRQDALLVGMASERQVQTAFVSDFTLGTRTMAIRTAPIIEGAHIGGADGILGLDSLQNQRVLFDFRRGELHVSDSFEGGGASSYDIVVRARERLGQLIIWRADVDGVRTAIIIDTGATGSIGNPALFDRLRRRQVLDSSTMTDVNGVEVTGETRMARQIEIDSAQLNNVPITFTDSPTFRHLGLSDRPAMILGMSELRLFDRVAIDFRARRVLFDIPGTVPLDQSWNFNERATRLRH